MTTCDTGRSPTRGHRRRGRTPGRTVLALLLAAGLPAALVAAGTPAGAAVLPGGPPLVESTLQRGKAVAFTFDDGPNPADTPDLLRVLREHGVRAVFCLVGDQAEAYPDLVRAIVEDGHTLCNHSMHHDDLSGLSPEEAAADMEQAGAAIRAAAPGTPIPYFRAPYGFWGATPEAAAGLGMQPLSWRLSVADWEPPGTGELVRRLQEGITPGAVVLLHDGGGDRSQTVQAVDRIIPVLRADGWTIGRPAPHG